MKHQRSWLVIASLCAMTSSAWADEEPEVRLGAYVQPGYTFARNTEFNPDDQDGFEFNNARLTGSGSRQAGRDLETSFRFNFDVNQGNFSVRDVYGTLSYLNDFFAVDVGQMKSPFGLALIQSEAYMQMPVSSRTRQLAFDRDLGLRLRGQFSFGGDQEIRWFAMAANGEGGFSQRRNLDDEYVFTGRVEYSPMGHVGKGESDLQDSDLLLTLGANAGYTSSLNNDLGLVDVGAKELRYGADLRLKWRGLSFRSELLIGDREDNESSEGFGRYGGYVQAGYVLPWAVHGLLFEPVARVEQIDINDELDGLDGSEYDIELTEVRRYEAGLTTYIAGHQAKVHLAYRRNDLLEGPVVDRDGSPLIHDTFLFFLHLGWY